MGSSTPSPHSVRTYYQFKYLTSHINIQSKFFGSHIYSRSLYGHKTLFVASLFAYGLCVCIDSTSNPYCTKSHRHFLHILNFTEHYYTCYFCNWKPVFTFPLLGVRQMFVSWHWIQGKSFFVYVYLFIFIHSMTMLTYSNIIYLAGHPFLNCMNIHSLILVITLYSSVSWSYYS
jgi:hypothetical protein